MRTPRSAAACPALSGSGCSLFSPSLTSALSGDNTVIAGTLNSTANTSFTVEFFANAAADPSGNGEGQRFLGRTSTTTNGSGNASFSVSLTGFISVGEFITATVTDSGGNTSEFSAALLAQGGPPTATVQSVSTNEDIPKTISLAGNDANGDMLHFVVTTQPAHGTLTGPTVSFTSSTIGVGGDPEGAILGEFNNDGYVDAAVINKTDNTISILLNNQTGGFLAPTTIATGAAPVSLWRDDLNRDGNLDLYVGSGNGLYVHLGNGNGTFASPIIVDSGVSTIGLDSGDYSGDGIPDLVVMTSGGNSITIKLGNGNGTFTNGQTLLAGTNPTVVIHQDFNGDNKSDLAVSNDGGVMLFLGSGNGTFIAPGISIAVAPNGLSVERLMNRRLAS